MDEAQKNNQNDDNLTKLHEKCDKNDKKSSFFNKFAKFWSKVGHFAVDLLYPKNLTCIACGRDVPNFDEMPLCNKCAKENPFNDGNRCVICDVQLPDGQTICDFCKRKANPIRFQKAFCAFKYNNAVRPAILRFKEDNARYLAPVFSKYICNKIKAANISIDVIIPVPAHKDTIKKRGYNQSQILAEQIGKELGVEVDSQNIIKKIKTPPQKSLNFEERQQNVYKSLEILDKNKYSGKNVLIVDDVMTTGATLNALSNLIYKNCHNIYVAAAARRDIRDSTKK